MLVGQQSLAVEDVRRGRIDVRAHALDYVRDAVDDGLDEPGQHGLRVGVGLRMPFGIADEAPEAGHAEQPRRVRQSGRSANKKGPPILQSTAP